MNNHKITNLATPTTDTDAATKGYVDAHGGALSCHTVTASRTTAGYISVTCDSGIRTGGGCDTLMSFISSSARWTKNRPTANGWECDLWWGNSTAIYAHAVCCSI